MSYAHHISNFVEDQLPQWMGEEAPAFAEFLKAYYEYDEQVGNALETLRKLGEELDIDLATEEFLVFFFTEVTKELPETIRANRKTVVKYIKQLYRAKGSQNAYKFLFQLLYNSDVEFFYPGEKIFRASDGRFETRTTLRTSLTLNGVEASTLGGETILATGGGRAVIETIEPRFVSGVTVYVLNLTNISGTFADGEAFNIVNSVVTGEVNTQVGPLASLTVVDGGAQHVAGDIVDVVSTSGVGTGGRARVVSVTDQSAVTFRVVSGGSGYRANVVYSTTENGGSTLSSAITGGSGEGASFRVVSLNNTENLSLNTDTISGMAAVSLASDPFSTDPDIGGSVASALSSANVNTTLTTALTFQDSGTIGSINEIELIDPGFGYETLPTVTAVDAVIQDLIGTNFPDDTGVGGIKAANAVIVANNLFGAIETVEIRSGGANYNRDNTVELSNRTSSNTFNGTARPVPTGIANTVGAYSDSNIGIIGGDNVLQDNFFYQEYSYVLRSKVGGSTFRPIVEKLLHPSGTKLFTEQLIEIPIESPVVTVLGVDSAGALTKSFDVSELQTTVVTATEITVTPKSTIIAGPIEVPATTVEASVVSFRISPEGIASTAIVTAGQPGGGSPTEIEFVIAVEEVGAIASTIAFGTSQLNSFIEGVGFAVAQDKSDPILGMEDVNLNASPFSSDSDIGSGVRATLAASDINDTLDDALTESTLFGIPTVS